MPPVTAYKIPAWADPNNASVLDTWVQKAVRTLGQFYGLADPESQAFALAAPLEVPGAGPSMTIKAYHGSPHDFERFDFSKIGTGEGAQAYGHGLYFAENQGTARNYRDALAGPEMQFPDGRKLSWGQHTAEGRAAWLLDAFSASDRSIETTYNMARRDLQEDIQKGLGYNTGLLARNKESLRLLDQWEDAGARPGRGGKMYEVNIHASPDEFLDWDKPLSEQSQKVQQALEPLRQQYRDSEGATGPYISDSARGEQIYREMAANRWPSGAIRFSGEPRSAEAAQALKDAGIKGIKYLDQGSRGSGQGTYNYVVFDDKIVEIAKKYGIALPTAAALYKWQQSQQQR